MHQATLWSLLLVTVGFFTPGGIIQYQLLSQIRRVRRHKTSKCDPDIRHTSWGMPHLQRERSPVISSFWLHKGHFIEVPVDNHLTMQIL